MVRTKEQYIKDLGRMKSNLYYDGRELDRLDDLQMDCLNTSGTTFEVFDDPEYKENMRHYNEGFTMGLKFKDLEQQRKVVTRIDIEKWLINMTEKIQHAHCLENAKDVANKLMVEFMRNFGDALIGFRIRQMKRQLIVSYQLLIKLIYILGINLKLTDQLAFNI